MLSIVFSPIVSGMRLNSSSKASRPDSNRAECGRPERSVVHHLSLSGSLNSNGTFINGFLKKTVALVACHGVARLDPAKSSYRGWECIFYVKGKKVAAKPPDRFKPESLTFEKFMGLEILTLPKTFSRNLALDRSEIGVAPAGTVEAVLTGYTRGNFYEISGRTGAMMDALGCVSFFPNAEDVTRQHLQEPDGLSGSPMFLKGTNTLIGVHVVCNHQNQFGEWGFIPVTVRKIEELLR